MWNTPNLLTFLRIVLIPVFVGIFYIPVPWARFACALVFSVAAVTDLARRLSGQALGTDLPARCLPGPGRRQAHGRRRWCCWCRPIRGPCWRSRRPSSSDGRSRYPPCGSGWPNWAPGARSRSPGRQVQDDGADGRHHPAHSGCAELAGLRIGDGSALCRRRADALVHGPLPASGLAEPDVSGCAREGRRAAVRKPRPRVDMP